MTNTQLARLGTAALLSHLSRTTLQPVLLDALATLGTESGDEADVLDQLSFLLRRRLTADLKVIAAERSARTRTTECAAG